MRIDGRVRAWEIIEEEDGSETLRVEYFDGTADEFRGVKFTGIEVQGDGGIPIPLKIEKAP